MLSYLNSSPHNHQSITLLAWTLYPLSLEYIFPCPIHPFKNVNSLTGWLNKSLDLLLEVQSHQPCPPPPPPAKLYQWTAFDLCTQHFLNGHKKDTGRVQKHWQSERLEKTTRRTEEEAMEKFPRIVGLTLSVKPKHKKTYRSVRAVIWIIEAHYDNILFLCMNNCDLYWQLVRSTRKTTRRRRTRSRTNPPCDLSSHILLFPISVQSFSLLSSGRHFFFLAGWSFRLTRKSVYRNFLHATDINHSHHSPHWLLDAKELVFGDKGRLNIGGRWSWAELGLGTCSNVFTYRYTKCTRWN